MIYLGYYDKLENYNHIRIIAQGTKADLDDLKLVAKRLNDDNLIRKYKVIEATNKTEAMTQLIRIARGSIWIIPTK